MRKFVAILSLIALATPALAAEPFTDTDRFSLQIDAGRLGMMTGQSREIIAPLNPMPPDLHTETPEGARAYIFKNLVEAVLDYNVVAYDACNRRMVDAALCTGPYLPRWLTGKASAYSDVQLRAMADEAQDHISPLWGALCDKAPKPADGIPVCSLE